MGFWIFMLIMDLLIPFTMIGFGKMFLKKAPDQINYVFGYRTSMSMKNQDTWVFAHHYCGKIWYICGLILLVVSLIVLLLVMGKSNDAIGNVGGILCVFQMIPLVGSIIPTEIALRKNFDKYGREDKITLLEGDATEILKELDGTYDVIFMDAAKGQYINFLPDILRLLSPGGLLISDNVLQDGDIIESRFAVTRRNRTIHARMREYLYELKHHPELETVILPVGDGVTLSTKAVRDEENR